MLLLVGQSWSEGGIKCFLVNSLTVAGLHSGFLVHSFDVAFEGCRTCFLRPWSGWSAVWNHDDQEKSSSWLSSAASWFTDTGSKSVVLTKSWSWIRHFGESQNNDAAQSRWGISHKLLHSETTSGRRVHGSFQLSSSFELSWLCELCSSVLLGLPDTHLTGESLTCQVSHCSHEAVSQKHFYFHLIVFWFVIINGNMTRWHEERKQTR